MFDYINYQGEQYQTKDTYQQALDTYEIREDGTLWRDCYKAEMVADDDSFFGFTLKTSDHYWKFEEEFDGLIRFYREDEANGGYKNDAWIEYKALFMDGRIIKLEKLN
jgi:hypothetical protein